MSLAATALVALTFGPLVLLSFLLDPGAFLARNGVLAIGYLAVATLGSILYLALAIRFRSAVGDEEPSVGRRATAAFGRWTK